MSTKRKKEKSSFTKDGTCRCCYDKRSKAVDGVLGKAHTKCVHQRGYCIGHEKESDGLQVMDRWMLPGPSRAAAAIVESDHVSEPAASSVQPVAVGASSSSCSTARGAAASSAAATTETAALTDTASTAAASTETAALTDTASTAAASTETAALTDTASTAAASTAAAAARAAVSFTSSPSRRSARAGGAFGTTAIAERRSPSKAAADTELKALKAELAAAVAELEKYKSEREQSAAMAAVRTAAAVDASVMQAQVDAHLAKLIAKRIADAATHNTSHSIGTPHVAAAIRATFAHARARATSPPLSPSRQLMTVVFEAPKALDIDEYIHRP
jgi:hypothetical protein